MTQAEALSILKTGANVFLTGEPGSGKTHTVNAYVAWLRSHAIEPAITASTGIAATHIHGLTIHSWSGIGIKDYLSPQDIDIIASKEHVAKRIQKAHILIIDEISMLSGNVLGMVDDVCREVRRVDTPFGGLQVVLVGDFFQLPPITRSGSRGNEDPAFAFASLAWQRLNPIICYLTEQHRQQDKQLLNALSAVRSGEWDHTYASTILSREVDPEGFDEDVPRLFTHNVDVDRINTEKLSTLPGKAVTYHMDGTGAATTVEGLKRGCLSPETLTLKEDAVVMGTKNIPALGLANGTLGVVTGFERDTNYPILELHDGTTITVPPAEWAVEQDGKVRAKITQIPLRLAWAITIHKSQGMSMDAAAIDLSRTFEYGQGYVALSRVRSLEGLYLLGWSENAWMVHPNVRVKDEYFRELSVEAERAFGALESDGERAVLEQNFIQACGGVLEELTQEEVVKKKTVKESTYDETAKLISEGKTIEEVIEARGLTFGTICDHIEKLSQAGKMTLEQAEAMLSHAQTESLPHIYIAFRTVGSEKLTPAFEHLKGKYSYNDLKLGRVLYLLQAP